MCREKKEIVHRVKIVQILLTLEILIGNYRIEHIINEWITTCGLHIMQYFSAVR